MQDADFERTTFGRTRGLSAIADEALEEIEA
jgi:hypothetical protein